MESKKLEYNKELIKKSEIIEAKFPQNIRPHYKHEVCILHTDAGRVNELCKDCQFCGLSDFSRQANELGMNGQMHTKGDGLEPRTYNPKDGIELRTPFTKIIQKGKRWVCHNPNAGGKLGIYILDENVPPCTFKIQKIKTVV
jgi:hypothetical protein